MIFDKIFFLANFATILFFDCRQNTDLFTTFTDMACNTKSDDLVSLNLYLNLLDHGRG